MVRFEELRVYQEGLTFVDAIYNLSNTFPQHELFGLTSQLRRASVSIVLNIAEGSSRTKKEFKYFIDLARGSCFECIAILTICKRRKYIHDTTEQNYYKTCTALIKMLHALKNALN